jgi:hypothetical protein
MSNSISAETLAEAFRQAMNPSLNERLHLQERPPGAPHVRIPCVSPSGARFDAVVASSKTHPHFGRVRALENYRYPETFFFGERVGGAAQPSRVIDGKTREYDGKRLDLNPEQKMTLTRATWNRDLHEYVGKEFDVMIREDLQPQIAQIRRELEAKLQAETDAMLANAGPSIPETPVQSASPEVEKAIAEAERAQGARKTK